MSSGCLDESLVVAFLGGTLPAATRDEAEVHIAVCSACADLITWAAADMAATASRALGNEGQAFVRQLTPGSRVGRYQILGAVGRGGMGEVYAAYHPDLDRRIALKVVNESGANSGERRARLLREARAIARLSHPNVVAVHDAGTLGDRVFIAMEFVDGVTVDEWLRAAPRAWKQVLDVFVAAGHGLAAAHAADIVHRDFKPQNVMIGKDGGVRVTDFGVARLVHEEAGAAADVVAAARPAPIGSVTKTGALLGTPAYMSPEQFYGGAVDARSDQFSFCVALREAIREPPGWLRSVILRGSATDRDERFPSMAELLATLERGRTRPRRRAAVLAAALALVVVATSGWRLARGERFACSVPEQRVAAAWSADDASDPRRQTIRAAFLATGRPSAETSWRRLSATLDEYVGAWNAMYLQACEATNVRGEQSPEVLDLRMSCLADNLDQVRALTDALAMADTEVVANAVSASKDLTPVARCADVAMLRSAVPPPRDDRTLREVRRLRRSLAQVEALREVGKPQDAFARAVSLRPAVEATGYKPLLGELLVAIGMLQTDVAVTSAEDTLEQAMFTAEAVHDDVTAAKAAITLTYDVGYTLGRHREAERWAQLANAILERLGPGHERLRAWAFQSQSANAWATGDFKRAQELSEHAVALKENALGKDHPDVAVSLYGLGLVLKDRDRPEEGLEVLQRAITIFTNFGDPASRWLADAQANLGEVLATLGREAEAEAAFVHAMQIYEGRGLSPWDAFPFAGMGDLKLSQRKPAAAIPFLQRALEIREQNHIHERLTADVRFSLARALWDGGGDKRAAISLARSARAVYARYPQLDKEPTVASWLATHRI
jgi:serine/threonine protein kinase